MKKAFLLFLLPFLVLTSCQTASAMGIFFEESQAVDPITGEDRPVIVVTQQGQEIIETIDTVGDVAGAVGVPFASYAGELAAGLAGVAGTVFQAIRARRYKKGAQSIIRAVEAGTTDGRIKRAILQQSNSDKTGPVVHQLVTATIPKMLVPDPQLKLDV